MEPYFGQMRPQSAMSTGTFGEVEDPELARAIEASYRAQTDAGMQGSEEDMIAEAMRLSRLEEEARKKRELGLPEDDEDAEYVMMDDDSGIGSPAQGATAPRPDRRPMPPAPMPMPTSRPVDHDVATGGLDDAFVAQQIHTPGHGFGGPAFGESLAPSGMDAEAMVAAAVAEQADMSEAQLAKAIEASWNDQTPHGRISNEDDLIAQALRISKQEEENRQRASLREEQDQELQESILMDQMRAQEEKRRRTEEQELQRLEEERRQEEVRKKDAELKARKEQEELKKSRIPQEPPAGEPNRVDFMIRLPDGKRVRRAFRGGDTVGQVYDYIDVEACEAVSALEKYRLVTTMPRQCYEDRACTLADAGLKGQCALVIEGFT